MKLQHRAITKKETTTYSPKCANDNNSGDLPSDKRHPFNISESLKHNPDIGHQKNDDTQSTEGLLNKESGFPIASTIGKYQYKPVGGSGWLNKYTSWKTTENGSVEYPRIKEGTRRSPNKINHWYWKYCRRIKSKIECIGCPRKKVRAVEQAIAKNIPHQEIYKFIVADEPAPPT